MVYGNNHFFGRNVKFLPDAGYNADIRLMRQQPVHLVGGNACLLQTLLQASHIAPTANLNTSLPFIRIYPGVWVAEMPPVVYKFSYCVPSAYTLVAKTPVSSDVPSPSAARTITAPAPSPNKTQVLRSVQSVTLERLSTPITAAVFI